MYTGIVDHCGVIQDILYLDAGKRLKVSCEFSDLQVGESVAVNGVCLTVVNPQANSFYADVSPETLSLTNISQCKVGDKVNVERCLRLQDRIGGHMVQGHVDQTCVLDEMTACGEFTVMQFVGLFPEAMDYFVHKGSVAVNGVSLTINEVTAEGFSVMVIPHTLQRTNLQYLSPGDKVNIEYDWMMKVIIQQLKQRQTLLD
jgi:riboflavin synthase